MASLARKSFLGVIVAWFMFYLGYFFGAVEFSVENIMWLAIYGYATSFMLFLSWPEPGNQFGPSLITFGMSLFFSLLIGYAWEGLIFTGDLLYLFDLGFNLRLSWVTGLTWASVVFATGMYIRLYGKH